MINLDNLDESKIKELEGKGVYVAGVNTSIKSVLLNAKELRGVAYCDVNNGVVLVYTKCNRDGFMHELLFGDVEIVFEDWANDLEKLTD